MPKLLIGVLLVLSVLGQATHARAGQQYVYVDMAERESSIWIDPSLRQGAIGHRGQEILVCSPSEAFQCFEIGGMLFSIPRDFGGKATPSSWDYRGQHFDATPVPGGVTMLGKRLDVIFIESRSQAAPILFWYTAENGLVAIKGLRDDQHRLFFLESNCGFASPPACK